MAGDRGESLKMNERTPKKPTECRCPRISELVRVVFRFLPSDLNNSKDENVVVLVTMCGDSGVVIYNEHAKMSGRRRGKEGDVIRVVV